MSFWDIGGEKLENDGNFENDGGTLEPIPDGTQVLALIDEAKWDAFDYGDDYISLRWTVMAPEEYKNRKIFQKLWVLGNNPRQTDETKREAQGVKAKKMLAAIDHNAGGKLMASGEAPTDDNMARTITNKPMVLKLRVWEMEINGETKSGNWIAAVSPRNKSHEKKQEAPAVVPAPAQAEPASKKAPPWKQSHQPAPADDFPDDFDDSEIPF
jgi:hypothetical protein